MSEENYLTRSARHEKATASRHAKNGPRWFLKLPAWARTVLVAGATLLCVVVLAAGIDAAVSAGRIHPGVRVGDISVGGMTLEEARTALQDASEERSSEAFEISAGGAVWEVAPADLGLSIDATALAESAYAFGRGPVMEALQERLDACLGGTALPLNVSCDEDAVSVLISDINATVATEPVDATIVIDGASVSRTDPVDGYEVDEDGARQALLDAFMSEDHTLAFALTRVSPKLTADNTEAAFQAAKAMVSAPLTLYYEDKEWEVPPETIGSWVAFRVTGSDDAASLEAYISAEEVSATVLPMVAEVGRPAKDASFSVSNGTVTIVPSENGLGADAESLAARLTDLLASASSERRAELTMHAVEPALTTEEAKAMGIVERLGTFTTEYASSNKPRVHNIHLLADALDGTLIAPGETFSFNDTVGERTAAKGYQEAGAIVNGELVPQLGGGICQVGTTIFNAVFFSGLPVVERHNHSLYISHYPKGRDATVSWGGPDFKFQNDTDHYVLVATSYTNSSVTVSIYGTNPGYEVTYDTGSWTNIVKPSVKEIKDDTLPVGARVVETAGESGRTIVVTRHVWLNGKEIRTDTFKSVYRSVQEVVRVGTKVTQSGTTTSTP